MTTFLGRDTKEKQIPLGSVLEERLEQFEASNKTGVPWEQVKSELEEKWGPFDHEGYRIRVEEERVEKERIHAEAFIGSPTLKELIKKIYSDYKECIKRDRAENPWKYLEENV